VDFEKKSLKLCKERISLEMTLFVNKARAIVLLLFWATVGAVPGAAAQNTQAEAPSYSCGPVTPYSDALPGNADSLRSKRSERYNVPGGAAVLGEDSEDRWIIFPKSHAVREPFPLDDSDAVVIGTVTGGQAFLSNDERGIYTEFTVSLQEVLAAAPPLSLLSGNTIMAERKGGAIRLPSGKVLARCMAAQSMPLSGRRYLLFLKYRVDTRDFAVNTGYDLEGGAVFNLDDFSAEDDRHELNHALHRQTAGQSQFIARVKAAIVAHKETRQ